MTKEISLSNGDSTLVDDEDYDFLVKWKWRNNRGYAQAWDNKTDRKILMHRVLMKTAVGQITDHINGNRLDNRKCNLRLCTPAQSVWNTKGHEDSTSIHKGVSWNKKDRRWRAAITIHGKRTHLGSFKNEIDAANAYNEKAKEFHGEFAKKLPVFVTCEEICAAIANISYWHDDRGTTILRQDAISAIRKLFAEKGK